MSIIFFKIFLLITICFTFVKGLQVPCYYIFGGSGVDAGNNNRLITEAKANYQPYGIDFNGGISTGRFTNGKIVPDFIAETLGFNSTIKPSNSGNITNQDILQGLNFASGAAGILDETGINFGERIPLNEQILNYKFTIAKLQLLVHEPVANYLSKCLFTVNIGSSDYLINYFVPQNFLTRSIIKPEQFAQKLVAQYKLQLQAIYNSGARKMAIFGLGQLGCSIAARATFNSTGCVEEINQAVQIFNTKVVSLVDSFNQNLPGSRFTFINITSIQNSIPISSGIITNSSCCKLKSNFLCEPNTPPCANRNIYAFMDGIHRTQFVNQLIARIVYNTTNRSFVHPMNIQELVRA